MIHFMGSFLSWDIEWQTRYFGAKVKLGNITDAEQFLSTMPVDNQERQDFNFVQGVNLKRYKGISSNNTISNQELDDLKVIAESLTPTCGYARSLYSLLTGHLFQTEVPVPSKIKGRNSEMSASNDVVLYPNPTKQTLTIRLKHGAIDNIGILDIKGNKVFETNGEGKNVEINMNNLSAGIYYISITKSSGEIITEKVTKL